MHLIKTVLFSLCAFAVSAHAEPRTVPLVDLTQYVGRWYQISANPTPYQAGCFCAQQTLTAMADGNVGVYNPCNVGAVDGKLTDIRGTAVATDKSTFAKFEVDFNLPWKGEYWVVGLAVDYTWAVVTDSKGESLYVLSRTPTMSPEAYNGAIAAAQAATVDVSKLVMQTQLGCSYPPL